MPCDALPSLGSEPPPKEYGGGLPMLEPDATSARKFNKFPLRKEAPYEDLIRTFPIPANFDFRGKTLKEKRDAINKMIRENDVRITPLDLREINDVLYPEHDDDNWLFRKEQFERNPELKKELENYQKRIREIDSLNVLNGHGGSA
jgi:hypothetical protein